tara:strand:- start:92 stop:526 length:435 start_codon:yes stop_codon:yes gene_type:complete
VKKIIHAISFLHQGERVIIKPTSVGKFRVPVSEVVDGSLKTRMKSLTAMQIIKHEVIKNCDPTFYLSDSGSERIRVFPGGDSSYLPAQSEGIAVKHDELNKVELPKLKIKPSFTNKQKSKFDYEQASLDIYGWYPGYDNDGNAD